jgi:hypothetical protein
VFKRKELVDYLDLRKLVVLGQVRCYEVDCGFGGRDFQVSVSEKIAELREVRRSLRCCVRTSASRPSVVDFEIVTVIPLIENNKLKIFTVKQRTN